MYGTLESALTSLPKNVLQAVVSTLLASLALYAARLEKMRPKTYMSLLRSFKETKPRQQNDEVKTQDEIIVLDDDEPCDKQDEQE